MVERCLKQALDQGRADRAALVALQADWSCKQDCYRVDTLARSITAFGEPLVGVFQPGAAAVPDGQVTPEGWEQSARANIAASEAERARSIAYRSLLQPMLDGAVRDVRSQAARVEDALARNVALVARAVEHFDEQYRLVSAVALMGIESLLLEATQLKAHSLKLLKPRRETGICSTEASGCRRCARRRRPSA